MSGTQLRGYDVGYWIGKDRLLDIALRGLLLGDLRNRLSSVAVPTQGRSGVLSLTGVTLSALNFKSANSFELTVRSASSALSGFGLPARAYIVTQTGETLTSIGNKFGFNTEPLLSLLKDANPQIGQLLDPLIQGQGVNIPELPPIAPSAEIGELQAFLEIAISVVGTGTKREILLTLGNARLSPLTGLPDSTLSDVKLDPALVREAISTSVLQAIRVFFPNGWIVYLPQPLEELCNLAPFSLDLKLLPSTDAGLKDALAFLLNLVPGTQGRRDQLTRPALPSASDLHLDLATRLVMRLVCCTLPQSPHLAGLGPPAGATDNGCTWINAGPINVDGTDYHVNRLSVSIATPDILVQGELHAGDPSWGWQAWATFSVRISLDVDANGQIVPRVLGPKPDVRFELEWWVWLIAALLALVLGIIGGLAAGSAVIGVIVGVIFFVIEAVALLITRAIAEATFEDALGRVGVEIKKLELVPSDITRFFGAIRPRAISVDDIAVDGALIAPISNNSLVLGQAVPWMMILGRTYSVSVTLRNTGNQTWVAGGPTPFRLGSRNPHDNNIWGRNRVSLPGSVRPGATITLPFSVTAPSMAGTYNFQWQMVQDGVEWFGGFSPNVPVVVKIPPRLSGISPSSGRQGEALTVWISGAELTGTSSVSFGYNTSAIVRSVSSTRIEVRLTIGSGAQLGPRSFVVYTPTGALQSGASGLSFTIARPYGAALGEAAESVPASPARVEWVQPGEQSLPLPPSSILVTFTKPVRWATLTPVNVQLLDEHGTPASELTIEPYPFMPSPDFVTGVTIGVGALRPDLAQASRPLVLTLRLNGSGRAPIEDLDGCSLDGGGNGGMVQSDFLYNYTLIQ